MTASHSLLCCCIYQLCPYYIINVCGLFRTLRGCLSVCVWYVLHWLSRVTAGRQRLKPSWERGRTEGTRGVWTWHPQLARDITPAGTGSKGAGRVGYSRWHQDPVWVSWSSSWVNLDRKDGPLTPPSPAFVSGPPPSLRPSTHYLPSLTHTLIVPCVSSSGLPFISLSLLCVCVYLYLSVCLLLIRSLWPRISVECDQTGPPAGLHIDTNIQYMCMRSLPFSF